MVSLGNNGAVNIGSGSVLTPIDVVFSGCSVSGSNDGSYRTIRGAVASIVDCEFSPTIYTQSGNGNGTVLLGGSVTLGAGVLNSQVSYPGTYPFVGSCVVQDDTNISYTGTGNKVIEGMKTLVVGANATINGNPVSSGTYTSATLYKDGTITEA